MIRFTLTVITLLIACVLGTRDAASAAASAVVTVTSSTSVVFNVSDMSTAALAGTGTITASVTFTTTFGGGGTIVINAPATLNAAGDTLSTTNLKVTCTRTSGNTGFTSTGATAVNGATVCANLGAGRTGVSTAFSITFTLDDRRNAPVPFNAANFGPGSFSVTGTAT
jgi:hypothetical protein